MSERQQKLRAHLQIDQVGALIATHALASRRWRWAQLLGHREPVFLTQMGCAAGAAAPQRSSLYLRSLIDQLIWNSCVSVF